jgi:hypothetical protein
VLDGINIKIASEKPATLIALVSTLVAGEFR